MPIVSITRRGILLLVERIRVQPSVRIFCVRRAKNSSCHFVVASYFMPTAFGMHKAGARQLSFSRVLQIAIAPQVSTTAVLYAH